MKTEPVSRSGLAAELAEDIDQTFGSRRASPLPDAVLCAITTIAEQNPHSAASPLYLWSEKVKQNFHGLEGDRI
jgi:hypothetical protein